MLASLLRRLLASSLVLLASTAIAGEPYLVKDIYVGIGPQRGFGRVLAVAGDDHVFIFADEREHGREPWVSDGTAEGTRLLRDICPGECSSLPVWQWTLGDRLLFSARSTPGGEHRLWVSDGTWEGTRPLGSGVTTGSAAVGELEDLGLFFFAALGASSELEGLWATDGTPAGTRPVGLAGPDGWPTGPYGISQGRGALILGALTSGFPLGPWVTDGTDQGTRRLGDAVHGVSPTAPFYFRRLSSGTVFFSDYRFDVCDTRLWFSDGTLPGTVLLRVFEAPGCSRVLAAPVLQAGDAIYFIARDGDEPRQLWRSDGTAAGTRRLTTFSDEAFDGRSSYSFRIGASDEAVLFAADDGVTGMEPWIADASGARRLADLCPGVCSSSPDGISRIADRFYFRADDGTHGVELWRSDGTPAGTRLVHDACSGGCSSFPFARGAAGGRVFFVTDRTDGEPNRELWAAPAGGEGAVRLTDFAPGDPFPVPQASGFAATSTTLGDSFLFTADDGEHRTEVWRSDGTPEGTRLLRDIETSRLPGAGSEPVHLTAWNGRVLFFAREPDVGYQPWISDGTAGGTRRLGIVVSSARSESEVPYSEPSILGNGAVFVAGGGFQDPLELWRAGLSGSPVRLAELGGGNADLVETARAGQRAVFLVQETAFGDGGLWATDGTAAGTRLLASLEFPDFAREGGNTGELGGRVYFAASADSAQDLELWATDGTEGGTSQVIDIAPGFPSSAPGSFATLGGQLLFAATTDDHGRELWTTDGTAAGTRLLTDLRPGFDGSQPRGLTTVGDRVFFFADDGPTDVALWTTDGTAAGTVRVAEVPELELFPIDLPKRAVAGDRLFFVVEDESRFEPDLWVSDGSAAGTGSLLPLLPPSSAALGVWSAGDRVWVSIERFGRGFDLWETDGTFAGTRRRVELPHPGFDPPIDHLAESGGILFFRGPHPEAGPELMALPLGPPEPCSADAETLCLGGGRFAVRAHWRDPRSGDTGTAGALPLAGSDRTGLFWFFQPDNVELVVKNLAAGPVNGYYWNFYGALSDVEYTIEVTDTTTGRRVEYLNPGGEICGRGDTTAFPARPPVPLPVPAPAASHGRSIPAAASDGAACGGSAGDLCLLGDRFRIEVEWADPRSGDTGAGTAIPYADRSGFFWFFNPENIELVVKMIDGRDVNGRFWVFYGALSDVEYTITVTDTETGSQASYHNPPGEICGRGDTAAF